MMNISYSFNHQVEVDIVVTENMDRRIERPDLPIQHRPLAAVL